MCPVSWWVVIHIFVLIDSTEFDELTLTNGVSGANYQCQVSLWMVDKSNDWLSAAVGKSDTQLYSYTQLYRYTLCINLTHIPCSFLWIPLFPKPLLSHLLLCLNSCLWNCPCMISHSQTAEFPVIYEHIWISPTTTSKCFNVKSIWETTEPTIKQQMFQDGKDGDWA